MEQQTAVEWLLQELEKFHHPTEAMILYAKKLEQDKEFETKAYWFGRGVLAGRENRIEELQPKK